MYYPPAHGDRHGSSGQHAGAGGGDFRRYQAEGCPGGARESTADLEQHGPHERERDEERAASPGQANPGKHVIDLERESEATDGADRQPADENGAKEPLRLLGTEVKQQEHQCARRGEQDRCEETRAAQRAVVHLAQREVRAHHRKSQQYDVEEIRPYHPGMHPRGCSCDASIPGPAG